MATHYNPPDVPVLLPWVRILPWRQQSTLLSGLRGPDHAHSPSIKKLVRWLRPVTQENADPTTDYMREEGLPAWNEVKKDLEFSSVHYFAHLMHAMEIIAFKHPDEAIANKAFTFYQNMVHLLHLNLETEAELDARLKAATRNH